MKFATELVLLSAKQQDKAVIADLLHCHACLLHTTVMLCIRLSSMSGGLVAKPQVVRHAGQWSACSSTNASRIKNAS